jgi:hypothetical protein
MPVIVVIVVTPLATFNTRLPSDISGRCHSNTLDTITTATSSIIAIAGTTDFAEIGIAISTVFPIVALVVQLVTGSDGSVATLIGVVTTVVTGRKHSNYTMHEGQTDHHSIEYCITY